MTDAFDGYIGGLESPAEHAATVTPHDTNTLTNTPRALYVGTTGNLKVDTLGGETVTLNNLPDGSLVPLRVTRVYSTGTTASDIVALW